LWRSARYGVLSVPRRRPEEVGWAEVARCEDWDEWFRLVLPGIRIWFIDGPLPRQG